jgi:DNA-binding CsgD family transcriptional regulator
VSEPSHQAAERWSGLSPREAEVLELTSHGLTNVEVATRLRVSSHAVKFHLSAVYRKLNVSNRTEATALYLRSRSAEGAPSPAGG